MKDSMIKKRPEWPRVTANIVAISLFALLYWHIESTDTSLEHVNVVYLFSFFLAVILIDILIMIPMNYRAENKILECGKCGLVFRKYKSQIHRNKRTCPECKNVLQTDQ